MLPHFLKTIWDPYRQAPVAKFDRDLWLLLLPLGFRFLPLGRKIFFTFSWAKEVTRFRIRFLCLFTWSLSCLVVYFFGWFSASLSLHLQLFNGKKTGHAGETTCATYASLGLGKGWVATTAESYPWKAWLPRHSYTGLPKKMYQPGQCTSLYQLRKHL